MAQTSAFLIRSYQTRSIIIKKIQGGLVMVVVFSSGRSGTNLILEILTGSDHLTPTLTPENTHLFEEDFGKFVYGLLLEYLTKSDSHYCETYQEFRDFMINNDHAKIIWTLRHPYDMAMSKIRRGYNESDDGSLRGCVVDMYWMAYLYCEATKEFGDRILTIRVEDVIMDIEGQAKKMCEFLDIPFEEPMLYPWHRMRHEGKKERYPEGLDQKEIHKYLNWKSAYDGFLTSIDFNMEDLFKKLKPLIKTFGYEE